MKPFTQSDETAKEADKVADCRTLASQQKEIEGRRGSESLIAGAVERKETGGGQ